MAADKKAYFEKVAKDLVASTRLRKVDAVVHVEDKADIDFWQQFLPKYRVGRYKFLPATTNEKGKRTTGCTQCLKYKDFLCQQFFICIDSDLRYLLEEGLSAEQGILQTYSYSWENHYAFAPKLQQAFEEQVGRGETFNFQTFLQDYSLIVYAPFLFMLYQEKNRLKDFGRDKFKQCITLQYRKGDKSNHGKSLLQRLADNLAGTIGEGMDNSGFDLEKEAAFYKALGVNKENVYLYVRGHCLYNCLLSIGSKLCEGTGVDFEQNILKPTLAFDQYDAILKIKEDIYLLDTLPKKI